MAGFSNKERALRRMRALTPEVRIMIEDAMEKEAAELTELIRRRVPVDTGSLRDSVRYDTSPDRMRFTIRAGGLPSTRKKVRKGVRDSDFAEARLEGNNKGEFDYARAVEFGTSDTAAQPYFYPSYRQKKRGIRRRVKAAAKKGVAKAVKK